jgi:hypothetical protein
MRRTWFSDWPLLFPLLSAYWGQQAVLGVLSWGIFFESSIFPDQDGPTRWQPPLNAPRPHLSATSAKGQHQVTVDFAAFERRDLH